MEIPRDRYLFNKITGNVVRFKYDTCLYVEILLQNLYNKIYLQENNLNLSFEHSINNNRQYLLVLLNGLHL